MEAKTFEEILKFNPFHDARGRFASSNSFASYSANPKTKAGRMAIERSYAGGHGSTFNRHKESQGENINQNHAWLQGGPGAKALSAQGQLASQQPKTPPKPTKNYDKLGYADHDDADYHQLYNGRQYYQQQNLSSTTKKHLSNYLEPDEEPGSLYNFSQNMNQAIADGSINSKPRYKQAYDDIVNNMHNLGYNLELTRYDHGGFLDDQLKAAGISGGHQNMSISQLKNALVGHSYGDKRILSTSYNNFSKATDASTFTTREVKITYRAKASTQALMPGKGPGGDFGEMLLAPTNANGNKYKIVDVKSTGQKARPKGGYKGYLPLNQIEVIVEVE